MNYFYSSFFDWHECETGIKCHCLCELCRKPIETSGVNKAPLQTLLTVIKSHFLLLIACLLHPLRQPSLGVSQAGKAMIFVIIGPVGPYFATGSFNPVSLLADPSFVRAWKGGVGAYKMGGWVWHGSWSSNYWNSFFTGINEFLGPISKLLSIPERERIILSTAELKLKWCHTKCQWNHKTMIKLLG